MIWQLDGSIRDEHGLPAVVLSASEAAALHRELVRACDALEFRNGAISPQLSALRRRVAEAAAAFRGFCAEPPAERLEQEQRGSGTLEVDDLGTLVNVTQAADIVPCSPERIRRLIATRVLTSVPTSRGHHRIPLAEVESYRDNRSRNRRSEIIS